MKSLFWLLATLPSLLLLVFLFWIIQYYSILLVQFLILSSRHGSALTKFRCRSDFMPNPEDT